MKHTIPTGGYWDPRTSTVDWCESNYTVTTYCAEAINSFTNLLFFYLGVKGIIKYRDDPMLLVCYVGYLTIGVGSFLFHATLKYPMQLLDELPMIWTVTILLCASLSHSLPHRTLFTVLLTTASVSLTVIYVWIANPEILFTSFGFMLIAVVVMNISKKRVESADGKVINKLTWIGIPMLGFGFFCWLVDRHLCEMLQRWRGIIGQPWATILELHGWWHLAIGTCGHYAILWIVRLENGHKYRLVWEGLFPWLERIERKQE